MQKIVVDTNVVVSSNLVSSGNPAEIMKLFYTGALQLYYSQKILEEYKRVLAYKKLKFAITAQMAIINAIEIGGIWIEPPASVIPFNDEADRIFYDTAKISDAVLITGNIKHYPAESFIMTPAEFLCKTRDNLK